MYSEKPQTRDEVISVLRRIFNGGRMRRLPKSRRDTEVLLAWSAASLDPRLTFSEPEINARLSDWLMAFADPQTIDHVTLRRSMVDIFLLLRDPDGSTYRTNQTVINRFIEPDARGVEPVRVMTEVADERARRKHKKQEKQEKQEKREKQGRGG